jgi:hypothetical protein
LAGHIQTGIIAIKIQIDGDFASRTIGLIDACATIYSAVLGTLRGDIQCDTLMAGIGYDISFHLCTAAKETIDIKYIVKCAGTQIVRHINIVWCSTTAASIRGLPGSRGLEIFGQAQCLTAVTLQSIRTVAGTIGTDLIYIGTERSDVSICTACRAALFASDKEYTDTKAHPKHCCYTSIYHGILFYVKVLKTNLLSVSKG